MRTETLRRAFTGALLLIASSFAGLRAQADADVVILNDHLHLHQVFVFDADGERHRLGFVGHDQLKTFDVPADIEAMGAYRIALQQYLPLPQLGVSTDAPALKMTPVLSPQADETVSIVVGNDIALSSVEVVANQQQMFR
jgi:hypothetical protein